VVGAGGGTGIPNLCDMLQRFRIPSVGVVDRDVYEVSTESFDAVPHLRVTERRDFEDELVHGLVARGRESVLFDILLDSAPSGMQTRVQRSRLNHIANKYAIPISWDERDYHFQEIQGSQDEGLVRAMFLSWLDGSKGAILGRTIGERVEEGDIPSTYRHAIREAKELTTSNGGVGR